MKIKEFIKRGRELYVICPNPHPTEPWPHGQRQVALDLSQLDPEMDHTEVREKVWCTACGERDTRKLMVKMQTDRQMRQGRQR